MFYLNFSGLFCIMSVEDCHAHLWQGDTLGALPVKIIAVRSYCSLAECISSESKFMDSPCSCSCVGISDDTDKQVRGPLSLSYPDLSLGDLPDYGVLNRKAPRK